MKRSDVQKMLEDNGFKFVRQNKHPIFSDGYSNIVFPSSSGEVNHGLVHQIRSEIRKAVAKRLEILAVKAFKSSDPAVLAEKYIYLSELQKPQPEPVYEPEPEAPPEPEPPPPKPEPIIEEKPVAKFTDRDRKPIDDMIRAMHADDLSYKQIAKALNDEGFKSPSGSKINDKFVGNSIYRLGLARSKQALTVPKNRNWAPVEIAVPPPPPIVSPALTPPPPALPPPPPPPPMRKAPSVRDEAFALAEMIMSINWLETSDKLQMLAILNRKAQRSLK